MNRLPTLDEAIDRVKLLKEAMMLNPQYGTPERLEAIDWIVGELRELRHGRAPSGDLASAFKARKVKP